MLPDDEIELIKQGIYHDARNRVVAWVRLYGVILGVLAIIVSTLGMNAIIAQSVESEIKDRSAFIQKAFSEVASALAAETTNQIANSKLSVERLQTSVEDIELEIERAREQEATMNESLVRISDIAKELNDSATRAEAELATSIATAQLESSKAQRAILEIDEKRENVEDTLERLEQLVQDNNLTQLLAYLERDFYNLKSLSSRVLVCFKDIQAMDDFGTKTVVDFNPHFLFEEPMDIVFPAFNKNQISGAQFSNSNTVTTLDYEGHPCVEHAGELYAPFRRSLIGSDIREIPAIDRLRLSTATLPDSFNDIENSTDELFEEAALPIVKIFVFLEYNGINEVVANLEFNISDFENAEEDDNWRKFESTFDLEAFSLHHILSKKLQ